MRHAHAAGLGDLDCLFVAGFGVADDAHPGGHVQHALHAMLSRRVARWNARASEAGLSYPRLEGGFFTTVFVAAPEAAAAELRENDVFVVPQAASERIALCAAPDAEGDRLVDGRARRARRGAPSPG